MEKEQIQAEQLPRAHTRTFPNERILHPIPHAGLDLHFQRPLLIHQPAKGKSKRALTSQQNVEAPAYVTGVMRTPSQVDTYSLLAHI